ncbi:MAG: hypothetical protein KAQ93_05725 [Spirochaetales bacterium]|nr:hypothetical protein [Spirochaetales bacterium]
MRKKFFIISILVFVTSFASAQTVDSVIEELITDLTLNFKAENPDLVFRPNIAVVPFADNSPNAKKYEVGPALTALVESKMERSIIFSLVTDMLRDKMIDEINFSLSGLAESDSLEPGQIEAIDYFLTGQVTELGSDFLLSLRLVDVESGKVADAVDQKIPKDEVFETSEAYTSAYVSPYGIGIEFALSPWAYLYGDMVDIEGQPSEYGYFRIALNYRVRKWLVAWGGLDFSPGGMRFENTHETGIEYTEADFENISGTLPLNSSYGYSKDRSDFFSLLLGAGYVFNITKTFNVTLGAELSMSQTYLVQAYNLPAVSDDSDTVGEHIIRSSDISLWTVTPMIKLQYFITPRLAIHSDYGFKYQFSESNASYYTFQDGVYYGTDAPITELYNLDPSKDPEGREHSTDLTGHTISFGFGLYF